MPQVDATAVPQRPDQPQRPAQPVTGGPQTGQPEALSLALAERLCAQKDYKAACTVYEKLAERLSKTDLLEAAMADFLKVRMALCLRQSRQEAVQDRVVQLLGDCLVSRSPAVRALANYHLALRELDKGRYLEARMRGYRALALASSLQGYVSQGLDSECYFLIAEAVTREVLQLFNADIDVPQAVWGPLFDLQAGQPGRIAEAELWDFLEAGLKQARDGLLGPQINKTGPAGGGQEPHWSLLCFDNPAQEVVARFAASAGLQVCWDSSADRLRAISVAVFLPRASEQQILDVTAACAGLIAQPSADQAGRLYSVTIFDPASYTVLQEHRQRLWQQAMSLWEVFLLQYPADGRVANAHFALARLRDCAGQAGAAIQQYLLVASRFSGTALAPYALLNCSRLRAGLRDYTGAQEDLSELVSLYPDCRAVDQAQLSLATAMMESGRYEQAGSVFRKVYHLGQSKAAQRQGAFGAAVCCYHRQDWPEAEQWFTRCLNLADADAASSELAEAYFLLGKVKAALGKLEQAAQAFEYAIEAGRRGENEYVEVILALADAQVGRGEYVKALGLVDKIPLGSRLDEQTCGVLAVKARIFRRVGLAASGIRVLRDKVDYVPDAAHRAALSLELARCYIQVDEPAAARDILAGALREVEPGQLAGEIGCELAEVCLVLDQPQQAAAVCQRLLQGYNPTAQAAAAGGTSAPVEIRQRAFDVLGRAYYRQKDYDSAALAFAGFLPQPPSGQGSSAAAGGAL
jgi:tetratricopeptide (TPR) repeat protein